MFFFLFGVLMFYSRIFFKILALRNDAFVVATCGLKEVDVNITLHVKGG